MTQSTPTFLSVTGLAPEDADRRATSAPITWLDEYRALRHFLLDRLPGTIWAIDKNMRLIFTTWHQNPDLLPEQLVGRDLHELDHKYRAPDGGQFIDAHRRALEGESVAFELTAAVARKSQGEFIKATSLWQLEPLRDNEGTIVGALGIIVDISAERQAQAENRLLLEEVRESRERLKKLSRWLLDIQESERRSIARELHDEIGQALTLVKLQLQLVRDDADPDTKSEQRSRLAECVSTVNDALRQVRDLSLSLRPSLLDHLGLPATLRWYVARIGAAAGFTADVASDPPDIRLGTQVETICFRIAQEALTNVARHASATRVSIGVTCSADHVVLTIRDNGCGFDVEGARRQALDGRSLGVIGMEERASLAGGCLSITSSDTDGTTVMATLPIQGRPASYIETAMSGL
jgi:signal transduction histidine kinase